MKVVPPWRDELPTDRSVPLVLAARLFVAAIVFVAVTIVFYFATRPQGFSPRLRLGYGLAAGAVCAVITLFIPIHSR